MNPQTLIKNPLLHNGTSQQERLLRMLLPQSYQLDDRSFKDLIVAAYQYADLLYYYDETNTPDGDWQCFWEGEPLTFLAAIAALDTDAICQFYEDVEKVFDEDLRKYNDPDDDTCVTDPSAYYYLELINHIYKQAKQIELFYQKLPADLPLKGEILALINKTSFTDTEQLVTAFAEMIRYYKAIKDDLDPALFVLFYSERWQLPNRATYDSDIRFKPDGSYDRDKLRKLFHTFYLALIKIKQRAAYWFEQNLASPQLRQPHVALFLTFLHLFRHAQDSLNALTKRHLDYYYSEVLCLERRAETPDEVYLIFELSKDFNSYLLEKGTELLAGKDKNRRPLLFETIEDWVINKTQVAELKNIYFDHTNPGALKKIFAAPDARFSYDEQGNPVEDQSASGWRALGDDEELPKGEIGFAIASPQLILIEGKRIADIKLELDISPAEAVQLTTVLAALNMLTPAQTIFQVELSSTEEWISEIHYNNGIDFNQPNITVDQASFNVNFAANILTFRIILNEEDPPVDTLGAELAAQFKYNTQWPIAKIILSEELNNPAQIYFDIIRLIKVTNIEIAVDVKGIREKLIVQSDLGLFDGTQKFLPFGPVPERGNQFYIGSTEVFQKALKSLSVEFTWIDPPSPMFGTSVDDYYKVYRDAGIIVQDPFLQIDFIDRAVDADKQQVVRFGKREASTGNKITGFITDIEDKPLGNIRVYLTNSAGQALPPPVKTTSTPSGDDVGMYSLALPATLPGTPPYFIQFDPPNTDSDPLKWLEPLILFSADPTEADNLINNIKEFSTINVVLFPKSTLFGTFKKTIIPPQDKDDLSGLVKNVYDKPLSDVKVDESGGASTQSTSDTTVNYKFPDLTNEPTAIKFTKLDYENVDNVQVNKYSKINAYLKPVSKVVKGTDNLGADRIVSGNIIGTQNNAAFIDVTIEAIGTSQTATTMSASSGAYSFPIPAGVSKLTYKSDEIILLDNVIPDKKEINATLFSPAQIERTSAFDGNVELKILDNTGVQITPPITIVKQDGVSITTVFENNVFKLQGVNSNDILTFSKTDYESLAVKIDNYPKFEIKLFPSNKIKLSGTSSDGTIEITAKDLNGAPLAIGSDITVSLATITIAPIAGNPGKYKLTLPNDNAFNNVIFKKANFEDSTGVNIPVKADRPATIEIIFVPSSVTLSTGTNTINSKIIDVKAQGVAGIKVVARGTTIPTKLETLTTIIGDYSLNQVPTGINELILIRDLDNIIQYIDLNPIPTTRRGVFTEQIKRLPLALEITGTITDIKNSPTPLAGVKIEVVGTSTSTFSDSSGNYKISNILGNAQLKFSDPRFEELTVNIKDSSKINVKLVPKSIFRVIEGIITDVRRKELQGVTVKIKNYEVVKSTSNNDGRYSLEIPDGISNPVIEYTSPGYKDLSVPLTSSTSTYSEIDVVLFFSILNYVNMIDANRSLKSDYPITINILNLKRDVRTQDFSRYSPTLKRGFLRLSLREADFLHQEYPNVLIDRTVKLARGQTVTLPNPPYTPATNTIKLSYSSTQVIMGEENDGIDQYFHLLPFSGFRDINLNTKPTDPPIKLVEPFYQPSFNNSDKYFAKGNLYIGLQDLTPGENISLLIKTLEGSEKEANALPPVIIWSYLVKDNDWVPFSASQILKDTTKDLTRTGIIQFATSRRMVKDNTLLNNQLHWIRASAQEDTTSTPKKLIAALPDLVTIRAQVIQARFENNDNELSHLAHPLPAMTINKLAVSRAAVKKVEQPYASFNGRLPETVEDSTEYYIRISERLRHRNRAITIWDYEHITLEQFPKVHRAKCISHSNLITELAPGYVMVAVIPDLTQRDSAPDTTPEFSQGDLQEMAEYLRTKANYFVSLQDEQKKHYLQVVNPKYETILLDFQVAFNQGVDREAFKFILDKELKDFLCPWLANSAADISFGMPLHRSAIIKFIEQRPYVDALSKLKIYKKDSNDLPQYEVETEAIYPTTSRSILTTFIKEKKAVNETDHLITVVEEKLDLCAEVALP